MFIIFLFLHFARIDLFLFLFRYLHDICSPPIVHKNIKSSNILLDLELNPHLSDYGMANFHQVSIS